MIRLSIFMFLFCLSFQNLVLGQSVTFYPWQSFLEFSSNPENRVWAQARIQGNSVFSSMNTEFSGHLTVSKRENGQFYVGPGVQVNFLNPLNDREILNGYFLNIGTRQYPFANKKAIGLSFEISPYVSSSLDIGTWRYLMGLTYSFNRKKRK